jgi:hypothetical protein
MSKNRYPTKSDGFYIKSLNQYRLVFPISENTTYSEAMIVLELCRTVFKITCDAAFIAVQEPEVALIIDGSVRSGWQKADTKPSDTILSVYKNRDALRSNLQMAHHYLSEADESLRAASKYVTVEKLSEWVGHSVSDIYNALCSMRNCASAEFAENFPNEPLHEPNRPIIRQ